MHDIAEQSTLSCTQDGTGLLGRMMAAKAYRFSFGGHVFAICREDQCDVEGPPVSTRKKRAPMNSPDHLFASINEDNTQR